MAICIDGFRCPSANADIDPNYNRVHVLNQGASWFCRVFFQPNVAQCIGLVYMIFGVDYNIQRCTDDYVIIIRR